MDQESSIGTGIGCERCHQCDNAAKYRFHCSSNACNFACWLCIGCTAKPCPRPGCGTTIHNSAIKTDSDWETRRTISSVQSGSEHGEPPITPAPSEPHDAGQASRIHAVESRLAQVELLNDRHDAKHEQLESKVAGLESQITDLRMEQKKGCAKHDNLESRVSNLEDSILKLLKDSPNQTAKQLGKKLAVGTTEVNRALGPMNSKQLVQKQQSCSNEPPTWSIGKTSNACETSIPACDTKAAIHVELAELPLREQMRHLLRRAQQAHSPGISLKQLVDECRRIDGDVDKKTINRTLDELQKQGMAHRMNPNEASPMWNGTAKT